MRPARIMNVNGRRHWHERDGGGPLTKLEKEVSEFREYFLSLKAPDEDEGEAPDEEEVEAARAPHAVTLFSQSLFTSYGIYSAPVA